MAAEFVGIELQLRGADEVISKLKQADSMIKTLSGRKQLGLDIANAKRELDTLNATLKNYQRIQRELKAQGKKSPWVEANINNTKSEIDRVTSSLRTMQAAARTAGASFKQTFNSISSSVAHAGSAMQSLGNALTRLTSPFGRLTTGLLMGAGYKALNLFTEGISNSFERADTMKNYDRTLKALGMDVSKTFSIAGKEAKTAKENLDDAIQGLPTSLDEIMEKQKIYAGATGEMVESTQIAIAANNAALASGMDARSQLYMQRYMTALASGAELTKTQWQSMGRIAPLVMRQVAKELGYADNEYEKFNNDVQSGTVAGKEFLKAFQKVGTSGAVADAARAQTESWSGLFSNIKIAVTRMGANILETLNQTFADSTGRTLLQRLLGWDKDGKDLGDGVKAWINDMSESIQNWIKANPDKIVDFFEALKSIDIKGFMKGLGEGMRDFAKVLGIFANWASNHDMERLGRWMPRLNLFGKGLTVLGGILKGTRHIWGGLGAGMQWLAKGRLGKIGLFGKLASLFGRTRDIETAGEAGKAITKASPSLIKAFKNMALLSGIVAMPAVTAWGVTASARASVKNFKDTVDLLKDIDWDDAKKVLIGIGGYLGGSAIVGGLIGNIPGGVKVGTGVAIGETVVGVITGIASAFFALDMSLINKGLKNFSEGIKALSELPDIENADDLFAKVKNAISIYNKVAELLNGETPEVVTAKDAQVGGGLKGMGIFKSLDIENLSDAIKALVEMGNSLKSIANLEMPEGVADKAIELTKLAADVARAIGGKDGFGGGIPLARNLGTWSNQDVMTHVAEELIQLRRMAYHINALSNVQIPKGTYAKIKQLVDYCETIAGDLSNAFVAGTNAGGVKKTMSNTADQLIQLRRMAYHINKLAGTDVNTGGFSAFIEQLETALNELKALSGDLELDIEVKLSDAFGKSVTTAVNKIKEAKKKIEKEKTPIRFNIPVSVTFSITTNFGAALAALISQRNKLKSFGGGGGGNLSHSDSGSAYGGSTPYSATGGYVYRAKGGGIGFPGKPRGTDTVPTWLTPGEYVHNKQAVNTFGMDFMRKVNNLDVRGAMAELMHKAGSMANINRGTSIVNNYNNNQKVVINNNNNTGAGFTFKSASRFVGAF